MRSSLIVKCGGEGGGQGGGEVDCGAGWPDVRLASWFT